MGQPASAIARPKSGAPIRRESSSSGLVALGVERFEAALAAALGRSPAVKSKDDRVGHDLQRRVAVEVLRAAALGLAQPAAGAQPVTAGAQPVTAGAQPVTAGAQPVTAGAPWGNLRLFDNEFCETDARYDVEPLTHGSGEPEQLGELLEILLALVAQRTKGKLRFVPNQLRKQRGAFYTPRSVVDSVVSAAVQPWLREVATLPRVCDPALGGGAFLFGVARALVNAARPRSGDSGELRRLMVRQLHGFDVEPLAIAVTEAALLFWAKGGDAEARALGAQLERADALAQAGAGTFDLVIGNPPWVAYAGRATQPLQPERRRWLAEHYQSFHGYPTLQACFVELGARLAPNGRVALLVPSPIADLDGYRPMRRVLTRTHRVASELVEYGQDAFESVVQPCFGLIADADPESSASDAPFALVERSGIAATASRIEVPECLSRLSTWERFPSDCFREFGFQTTSEVTKNLLLRGAEPQPPFDYPLLEGRDVGEFSVGQPRLFLNPDRETLRRLHCRLREPAEFQQVAFLVRQTAKYTIAAIHSGLPFRNSLLAGFGTDAYSANVLVGLLNSTLLRSLHLAAQRDARQKTFPQVKVMHLRALPAPPRDAARAAELERWVNAHHGRKPSPDERDWLDTFVSDWYQVSAAEGLAIARFFEERAK